MKRFFPVIIAIGCFFYCLPKAGARDSQVFTNASVSAVITVTTATGTISACAGTASISPDIMQFNVSGNGLSSNIIVTAPINFEVSLTAGGGFGNSLTLNQSGGILSNTVIYVRSAATAPTGNITGNVLISAAGAATQSVPVAGTINALPVINMVSNQTFVHGTTTTGVTFTGTTAAINWTNNTPGIGLAASGTGNIAPFTAVNGGTTNVVATITATPVSLSYAYIANSISNDVSVINTATNTIVTTIPVGQYPTSLSVSPDGTRVYVTNQRSNSVSVISTASNTVLSTITIAGFSPNNVVVSPDGLRIYVVNLNSNNVSVISTITNSLIATVGVGGYPVGIAISPNGSTVYVANSSNDISVIDATTNSLKTTIPVSNSPYGVAVSPDGTRVYVAISGGNGVLVFNAATNAWITTIPVGSNPSGIVVSPDNSLVYVSDQFSKTVSVINATTNTVIATIPVGTNPDGISISADGSTLYVSNEGANTVSVINTGTNAVTATVPVGAHPISFGNFITTGTGCTGAPVSFTITVTPMSAGIIAGPLPGNISACAETASVNQQVVVSANGLTGDIIVTAPVGFEVSLSTNNGYGNSVTLTQSGGNVNNAVFYVRSSASDPPGNISGNVTLTTFGMSTVNIPVSGTINALPVANTVLNRTFANGTITPVINLTGSGNTFNWINDNPGIGLAANGSGDIPSFTAINTGSTPVIANLTVTPLSSTTGCSGVPLTFTIIVNPSSVAGNQAVIIPNTFTPNGDGINDTWNIQNLDTYTNCKVQIYNRYGTSVFSSIGYGVPWDGTYQNTALPTGTYYYIVNLENGGKVFSGFVAIIR
jgi:gliding motility-associated-like protein